jgi:RNA polymerase sigma factor (sigma-70 family)
MPFDLQLLQAGDDGEWNRAFDTFWDVAYWAVEAVIGRICPQDVEDVAEQVLVELVHNAIHRCHRAGMIVPVLRKVAWDRAIDRRRRFWAQLVDHPDQDLFDPADQRLEEVRRRMEHVAERLHMDGDLNAILESLVSDARLNLLEEALLREHILEGSTQQEFADRLGIALGTVGGIKASVIRKIRGFLEGRG